MQEWKKNPTRYRVTLAKDFNYKKSSNFAPAYIGEDADVVMFLYRDDYYNKEALNYYNRTLSAQMTEQILMIQTSGDV